MYDTMIEAEAYLMLMNLRAMGRQCASILSLQSRRAGQEMLIAAYMQRGSVGAPRMRNRY